MSEQVVAAPAPPAPPSDTQVTSSMALPERTPEEKAQGVKEAAARAEANNPAPKPAEVTKPEASPPVDSKPTEEPKVEEPAVDEKNPYGVPPKFLNEDGTPDYKRMIDNHLNIEKLLGKKGFSNVQKAEELTYTPSKDAAPIDAANLKAFQEEAFKNGMTKEQFALVMNKYETLSNDNNKPSPFKLPDAAKPDDVANIRKTLAPIWGEGNDAWGEGITTALKAVDAYLPSNFKRSDPVFNHPAVLALLANVGKELGEGNVTGKDKSGPAVSPLRNPAEIRASADYSKNPQKYAVEMDKWYAANPRNFKINK